MSSGTTSGPARSARGTGSEPRTRHASEPRDESTTDLVTGLLGDVKDLATAHGQALRNEVGEELSALSASLKIFSVALAVLSIGALLLVMAGAMALAVALDIQLWITYGGFSVVMLVIGYVLLKKANPAKRVADGKADLVPETSLGEAKGDLDFVKDQAGRLMR
jgi:hypothetical protein